MITRVKSIPLISLRAFTALEEGFFLLIFYFCVMYAPKFSKWSPGVKYYSRSCQLASYWLRGFILASYWLRG
jgi:hypothetical protein